MTFKGVIIRFNFIKYHFKYLLLKHRRDRIKVLTPEESIEYIKVKKCSIARYGDGELAMVLQYAFQSLKSKSTFQIYSDNLSKRLYEILKQKETPIGLPGYCFNHGCNSLVKWGRRYWEEFTVKHFNQLESLANPESLYLDTNFTRFYVNIKNKKDVAAYVEKVKTIWAGRNLLIVEGQETRLGVGNDLFKNANSIRRILCPPKNAWEKYPKILETTLEHAQKDDLILGALGMTATVLAYDVTCMGFQILDIGHIDIEYEWFLRQSNDKIQIPGKFTNEAFNSEPVANCEDQTYLNEIITIIR